jgi:uncharacterized alkaline shock family protein YloU
VSETSAGNIQAYDSERGSPRQATATAPYNEHGTGPLAGGRAGRPAGDQTGPSPHGDTGAGPLPIEAAAFGSQPAAPVSQASAAAAPALEPLPPQGTSPGVPQGAYGTQSRLSPSAPPALAPSALAPAAAPSLPPAADAYGPSRARAYDRPATGGYGQAAMPQAPDDEITVAPAPAPAPVAEQTAAAGPSPVAVVKGRVQIEDEVVEKVAGLAAVEVAGVADLGGNIARAFDAAREHMGAGHRRGTQGVRARIEDRQVAIHVVIVIEYGAIVMEVAKAVKANVARAVSHMLGLRVVEVNVTVDDVALPRRAATARGASAAEAGHVTDPFA